MFRSSPLHSPQVTNRPQNGRHQEEDEVPQGRDRPALRHYTEVQYMYCIVLHNLSEQKLLNELTLYSVHM